MDENDKHAWLPITPRGVATFARTRLHRLWLVQFFVAFFAALVIAWTLNVAWLHVVRDAIHQLPEQGQIRGGVLDWHRESPCLLAEGHWLAISVDTNSTRTIRSPSHVQVELGNEGFSFHSLLGYVDAPYPHGWIIELNRKQLEPKWGAWKPVFLACLMLITVAFLLVNWSLLAAVYVLPVWLVGYFLNRDLNFRECWKLAGSALMPGAIVLTLGVLIYGLALIDLVQLIAVFITHFVIGWIYLCIAPLFTSKKPDAMKSSGNPFKK